MKTFRILPILAAGLLSCACSQKTDYSNLSSLKGRWYSASAQTALVDRYVDFSRGYITTYMSEKPFPASSGKVFSCSGDDFSIVFMEQYSIVDGCLISGHHNFGPVSIDGDILRIDNKTYHRLSDFTSECFSTIVLDKNTVLCPAGGGVVKVQVHVTNPVLDYQRVTVSNCPKWVIGMTVSDSYIEFLTGALPAGQSRRDSIVLNYPFSKDEVIYLEQK